MDQTARHQVACALRAAAEVLASDQNAVAGRYSQTLEKMREEVAQVSRLGADPRAWWSANLWLAWRDFYEAGQKWGEHVIDNLAIPPKKAKAVEMAVRLFQQQHGRKGPRNGIAAWYDKNKERFEVLVEASEWPKRSKDDGIFQHGPFTIHNTINASEAEIKLAMKVVDLALKYMPRAELPGFSDMAYGHIYLVGEIGRKNWAAWYMENKDVIYLRPRLQGRDVERHAQTLLHELGHRYWRKKLDRETKNAWQLHHQRMLDQPSEDTLPEVGEVLKDAKVNNKTVRVGAYEPQGVLLINVRDDKPVGHMSLWEFKKFMAKINAMGKFPSPYAAQGGYEEHFCESLAFKAMGNLAPANIAAFDRVVLGKEERVAASVKVKAARPIKIDKRAVAKFVQDKLVPQVVTTLELLAMRQGDKPLGNMKKLAEAFTSVSIPGQRYGHREVQVKVLVDSRAATGKKVAVLAGKAKRLEHNMGLPYVEVTLYVNGALSPNDILLGQKVDLGAMGSYTENRLQPLDKCTSETCLPYGLYSLLTHEITHAAEATFGWKSNKGIKLQDGEAVVEDHGKYINDPMEVRAFMQQVVDEVLRYVRKLASLPEKKRLTTALRLSTTWSLLKDDLTQRNKKLILKAVYTALQDEGLL